MLHLYYSTILNIWFVGQCWYLANVLLVISGFSNSMYMSDRQRRLHSWCSPLLEKRFTRIECHSVDLGFNLSLFIKPIRLVLAKDARFLSLELDNNYEKYLFTLLCSSKWSSLTKKIVARDLGTSFLTLEKLPS